MIVYLPHILHRLCLVFQNDFSGSRMSGTYLKGACVRLTDGREIVIMIVYIAPEELHFSVIEDAMTKIIGMFKKKIEPEIHK
jgi:hypothetical protein